MSIADSLNIARQRVLSGEQLSLEEQRRLIAELRAARGVGVPSSASAKPKKAAASKAPTLSDEDLDAQLADLGL